MLTFAARHSRDARKPILLIDEAELHLHYRAQADLVEVFNRQDLAAQIVYTTHSAGCLPEDIGSAVRVVEPVVGTDRSGIRNNLWQSRRRDGAGITPLLISMGASALAFTPSRRAVMAEGPSDALLLPALFREVAELPRYAPLGFQVAPGIAWVPIEELPLLDLEAARVVYLVDSDTAGETHKQRLLDAGIEAGYVFELKARTVRGLTVEDFVDPGVYTAAVNLLLEHTRDTTYRVNPTDLPRRGRAGWLGSSCRSAGVETLSKTAIAEAILHLGGGPSPLGGAPLSDAARSLVDSKRASALRETLETLRAALGVGDESLTWLAG